MADTSEVPAGADRDASVVVSRYRPRALFLPFHNRVQRRACVVTHRRAGKTVACINELIIRALYQTRAMGRYGYVAPFRSQAKKVVWDYLKYYTEGMTSKVHEADLYVDLAHNGARISIEGADNLEALRGRYFDGLVLDEYGRMNPAAWSTVLAPTLADRNGWVVFIDTPNGKNDFYRIFTEYASYPQKYYTMLARVTETGIFTAEQIEEFRQEASSSEGTFEQEYLCDFSAAFVKGAYYAQLLDQLERAGHMDAAVAYDPALPVFAVFDLGFTDSTAIWFWQDNESGWNLINYHVADTKPLSYYFQLLAQLYPHYERIYLPHDAKAKSMETGRSRLEQFLEAGFPVEIVPRLAVHDGIEAARKILPRCWFSPSCYEGIEALRAYRRKWDEARKVFMDEPLHDFSSHPADAFRYFALVASEARPQAAPKIVIPEPWTLAELFEDRENRMRRHARWH